MGHEASRKRKKIVIRRSGVGKSVVTEKIRETGTVEQLSGEFTEELKKACRHFYNIYHQYTTLRELRLNLLEHEIVVHMDFSQNYNCKCEKEIQSMHFGASQKQITLHTGIVYLKNDIVPFCTVSDCNKHSPAGIWAHTIPVLYYIKDKSNEDINKVHFISDGPTTQYRSKNNFYLFSTQLFEIKFSEGFWNFLEAGHGKGPADGIGAAIKRSADRFVAQGNDISNAQMLIDALKGDSTIKLFNVSEEEVLKIESIIPEGISTIPDTMKIHQLYTKIPGNINTRVLSCYCQTEFCTCYGPKQFDFNIKERERSGNNTEMSRVNADTEHGTNELDEGILGKWCLVEYEKMIYPGIVQDVDVDDVEVKVMHKIGRNRYFWPMLEDILWYTKDKIFRFIDEPKRIGSRHFEIDKDAWEDSRITFDLD